MNKAPASGNKTVDGSMSQAVSEPVPLLDMCL